MKRQNINKSDIRVMDSTGVMDRGPIEFKSSVSHNHGDIMAIASKNIITLPPTTNIMGTAKTMLKYGHRRVPIADQGTNRWQGTITSLDIVDFLGGGLRHNIVKNRYKGNLAAAINEDVREIMKEEVVSLGVNDTITNTLKTMNERNIGGIPIVDNYNTVVGIVTERDFVRTVEDITN